MPMSPLLKIKQTTSLLVIFKKKKSGWVSLIEIIRVHNTIIYYNVTCIDVYKDSHSRHSRTRGDVVSGTRKTRLIRMQTYWKSQGSFPLTEGGEGGKNGARREYRNRKLLGFEKFKRRCYKKKKALFLLEPLSKSLRRNGESRISSWALKLKKSDATLRFFEKRNYHRQHRGW